MTLLSLPDAGVFSLGCVFVIPGTGMEDDEITPILSEEVPVAEEDSAPVEADEGALQTGGINNSGGDDEERVPELTGCGASALCDPRRMPHRFIALVLMCLLGFGSCFCYDNPGALQDNLKSDMGINTAQFANLYAWYSWPNVICCFIGGFLLDRFFRFHHFAFPLLNVSIFLSHGRVFGTQLGTIIFATLVLLGQIVFALGGVLNKFWMMEFGRFIFGSVFHHCVQSLATVSFAVFLVMLSITDPLPGHLINLLMNLPQSLWNERLMTVTVPLAAF